MHLQPDTLKYLQTLSPEDRKKFLAYLKDSNADVSAVETYLDSDSVFDSGENPLSDNPFRINLVEAILDQADDERDE